MEFSDLPVAKIDCDVLVLGLVNDGDHPAVHEPTLGNRHRELFSTWLADLAVGAGQDDAKMFPAPDDFLARSIVVVGLGGITPSVDQVRYAAGLGARIAGKRGRIALALPASGPLHTKAIVEGGLMGLHKTPRTGEAAAAEPSSGILIVRGALSGKDLGEATTHAEAVTWVRDRVSEPPNLLYPETFVERVTDLVSGGPVRVEVFDEAALAQGGFGGILGVGSGSARPPRLVAMRYRPPAPALHIALVGKGITFDSGGLSLKPANSMVGMKYDMTGAATVAGAVFAAARLGVAVSVTGWLCLAENMPSGTALRPNDVITIRGGKTVEVLNTDAEGRLVLADGLQRASEDRPDLVIDVATLTGAARVALGERYAGVMGDPLAVSAVSDAATAAGELVWPMPLAEELRSLLDSDVADIANAKPGNTLGGMLLAGLFLREFVGRVNPVDAASATIPWAHIDMAGPASNQSSAFGYTPAGPTGAVTRTLISLLSNATNHVRPRAEQ